MTEEHCGASVIEGATAASLRRTKPKRRSSACRFLTFRARIAGSRSVEGRQLEIRKGDRTRLRASARRPFTTPPLRSRPQGAPSLSARSTACFLNGAQLSPLGSIRRRTTRARRSRRTIRRRPHSEVAMVTRAGASWSSAGRQDAVGRPAADRTNTRVFADLDRDGALDVLVATKASSPRAFRARRESVWQVDDEPKSARGRRKVAACGRSRMEMGGEGVTLVISGDARATASRVACRPAAPSGSNVRARRASK